MGERAQRVRREPRMALNALAQYMLASAGQRETILREQKYPSDFRVIYYDEANRAILRFLLDPDRDPEILRQAEQRIRAVTGVDRNEAQRLNANADAVAAFTACYQEITFDELVATRGPQDSSILIEGVTVNVRPEVLLTGQYRSSASSGAVKIYLSRNSALGEEGAAAAGAVVHMYIEGRAPTAHVCLPRHCTVVDVFGRACYAAPRAVTRRRNEIQAACREIAQRWPTI